MDPSATEAPGFRADEGRRCLAARIDRGRPRTFATPRATTRERRDDAEPARPACFRLEQQMVPVAVQEALVDVAAFLDAGGNDLAVDGGPARHGFGLCVKPRKAQQLRQEVDPAARSVDADPIVVVHRELQGFLEWPNSLGDLPPRPECAPRWHARLRPLFPSIELTLLVGSYAIDYYLPRSGRRSMTAAVARWRDFLPEYFVLPHPSWRTTRWLRDNPWFENETLPELRARVDRIVTPQPRSAPCPRR